MSAANFYDDDGLNIFDTSGGRDTFAEFKADTFDLPPTFQMNYPYFGLDKNPDLDPTVYVAPDPFSGDGTPFAAFNGVHAMDYLNADLEPGAGLYMNGAELDPHALAEHAKHFNGDYANCESFSTRYTDGSFDQQNANCNLSLNYTMDSLTESMLKQLDTPRLFSQAEAEVPDSLHLNSLDPQILKRLYEAGININPAPRDDFYDLAAEGYYDALGADDPSRRDRFRTRRRGRRADDLKPGPPYRPDLTPKSPVLKGGQRPRNGTKQSFAAINYAWLKDSFFNCQILGNVVSIAQDQTGCRMLQRQLECNDYQFIAAVLNEVLDNLYLLMTDPFGNYLCQKLMTVCDADQLGMIITACEPQFIPICLNMHGTRAIQKLIEVVTDANIARITSILATGVVELVNDLNGNHVIQKCLVSLSSSHCEFIYRAMNENCVYLATHRHGCCVMQRCIDAASPAQRAKLVDTISLKTLELVEDAYGNYVIQYVLRLKDDAINSRIVSYLCEDVVKFAKQKFSSNVIERCLIFCPLEVRSALISKFLHVPFEVLKDLILDPFANYVIQRVLNVAQPDELSALLDRIQPHLEELKVASSGKRIAAKITRRSNGAGLPGAGYSAGAGGLGPALGAPNPCANAMFDVLAESTDDAGSYPGCLSSEYPSLSSNVGSSTASSQGERPEKPGKRQSMHKDRDYIIDLINRTNSEANASEASQERQELASASAAQPAAEPAKPAPGADKPGQSDPVARDFSEIFQGSYDAHQAEAFSNKLWAGNV